MSKAVRKKLLILGNMRKPGVADQIAGLHDWFAQLAEIVAVGPADALPPQAHQAKLAVVFGGDGTLLTAARLLAGTGIALVGVNMGKLGFLADFSVEHMQKHFKDILSGKIQPVERMMLEVSLRGCREGARLQTDDQFFSPAANDVAISAGQPFRMIDLHVSQADSELARYLGDGLVISTPSGSTGYTMSAGGPILEPTLDAFAITPVAPHTLSLRPIVVRSDKPIVIRAEKVNPGSRVIVDGQVSCHFSDGDRVEVRRAAKGALIVPHPDTGFFGTLADKLQWGHSPHHL